MNDVTLSTFAEGRMKLFGAEIFNNFSVVVVVPEPGWKQCIRAMYKPRKVVIRKCLPILAQKLAHFGLYLVNEGCCIQFPGRLVFFRRKAFERCQNCCNLPGVLLCLQWAGPFPWKQSVCG